MDNNSPAYRDGYERAARIAANVGYWDANDVVSIPGKYAADDGPKAGDGWPVAAHDYGDGYRAGWESVHPRPVTTDTAGE